MNANHLDFRACPYYPGCATELRNRYDDRLKLAMDRRQRRWVVVTWDGTRGRWKTILLVNGPEGEYIPFDRRALVHLAKYCDTSRFHDVDDYLRWIDQEQDVPHELEMAANRREIMAIERDWDKYHRGIRSVSMSGKGRVDSKEMRDARRLGGGR